jgi:chitinase
MRHRWRVRMPVEEIGNMSFAPSEASRHFSIQRLGMTGTIACLALGLACSGSDSGGAGGGTTSSSAGGSAGSGATTGPATTSGQGGSGPASTSSTTSTGGGSTATGGSTGAGGAGGNVGAGGSVDAGAAGSTGSGGATPDGGSSSGIWIDVYIPGYVQDTLKPAQFDFSWVTHVIHFAWVPTNAGGIDDNALGVDTTAAQAIVSAAHAAGKKVLISVGGAGYASPFNQAMTSATRATFVQTLVSTAIQRGYDGIDIDYEPDGPSAAQIQNFQGFSRDLRTKINATTPKLLLTTACLGASANVFAPVADAYDQVNIMTYDLVYGPNSAWHNSPVYSDTSSEFYSVDRSAQEYVKAGVTRAKLGIGIEFVGFEFDGATMPKQSATLVDNRLPYTKTSQLAQMVAPSWDSTAQATFLSFASPPKFYTIEDERSIKAKIDYLFAQKHGGLIIWDPSEQFVPTAPAGQQHPLYQAIHTAIQSH